LKEKRFFYFWPLMFLTVTLFAQQGPYTSPSLATVPKPLLIEHKNKIPDSKNLNFPAPPRKDADGTLLQLKNETVSPPQGAAIESLTDDSIDSELKKLDRAERSSGRYQWHSADVWSYCHHREGGSDWYGWRTGSVFHWVLYRGSLFWWRDTYAGRWLYFYKGFWWWASGKKTKEIQVYMNDGRYHACDANGVLGADLGTTGVARAVADPVAEELTPGNGNGGRHGGMGGSGR
jgi:hypothetical protein